MKKTQITIDIELDENLWTKEMPVDQMKMFIHQILISLGNTYERATGEEDVAAWIEEMAEEFAQKSAIKM